MADPFSDAFRLPEEPKPLRLHPPEFFGLRSLSRISEEQAPETPFHTPTSRLSQAGTPAESLEIVEEKPENTSFPFVVKYCHWNRPLIIGLACLIIVLSAATAYLGYVVHQLRVHSPNHANTITSQTTSPMTLDYAVRTTAEHLTPHHRHFTGNTTLSDLIPIPGSPPVSIWSSRTSTIAETRMTSTVETLVTPSAATT